MWPILLKILSIIGIALGGIIGLVLFLILLILLAPITYKLQGHYISENKDYYVKAKVHYLFGLVGASAEFPVPGRYYVRALWFKIIDNKKKDKPKKEQIKKIKPTKDKNKEDYGLEYVNTEDTSCKENSDNITTDNGISNKETSNKETINNENLNKEASNEENSNEETSDNVSSDNKSSDQNTSDKEPKKKKEFKFVSPIYLIKKKYLQFKHKFIDKAKLKYKDINFYIKLIQHDDTKALLSGIKKHVFNIIKQLLPKRGYADVEYGTGAPDTTAYIYGVYSVLSLKWTPKIKVVPDFEAKRVDATFAVKGYFNLMGIVFQVLPVILGKKLKLLRLRLNKHKENMVIAQKKSEKNSSKEMEELEKEYA